MHNTLKKIIYLLILSLGALLMLLPFVWMILTSLRTPAEALKIPLNWLPHALQWQHYSTIWHNAPFRQYFLNSILVTGAITIGQLLTGILAAFAFTHLRFYGQRVLFIGLIGLMLVPGELLLIPNFVTLAEFRWIDTYAALIVPWLASIFVLYVLYQAFQSTPRSWYTAARLDGASDWQYLWHILVPTNWTTIIAVAILQAIGSWNSFIWPLMVTNSDKLRTLPLGLIIFSTNNGTNYPILMTAATFVIVPMFILYLWLQKYLLPGISQIQARR